MVKEILREVEGGALPQQRERLGGKTEGLWTSQVYIIFFSRNRLFHYFLGFLYLGPHGWLAGRKK